MRAPRRLRFAVLGLACWAATVQAAPVYTVVVGAEERKRIRMFGAHQGFNILGCRHDREFRLQRFFMCKAHDFSHRL